jgi:leucyl-tRNA synthetase
MTMVERQDGDRALEGAVTGAYAINPASSERVPIYVADYVLPGYATGAIMAVPAHDSRDLRFAQRYGLRVVPVIEPAEALRDPDEAYEGEGVMVNSGPFDGQPSDRAWHGIAE